MPRYFFDLVDGGRTPDHEGTELADRETMRREAIGILPDIAREELPESNSRVFACHVRNESGTVIFIASLTLETQWQDGSVRT